MFKHVKYAVDQFFLHKTQSIKLISVLCIKHVRSIKLIFFYAGKNVKYSIVHLFMRKKRKVLYKLISCLCRKNVNDVFS